MNRSIVHLVALFVFASSARGQEKPGPLSPWFLNDPGPAIDWKPSHLVVNPAYWLEDEGPPPAEFPMAIDSPPRRTAFGQRSLREWCGDCKTEFFTGIDKVKHDFINNYTGRNLTALGLTLLIAAPLANTQADENFRNWYQHNVRSPLTNSWANVGNKFGQHFITVPVFVACAGIGKLAEDYEAGQWIGDFGKRSIRALMVGAPSVSLLQVGLGAGRPGEGENSSYWRPFHDKNAVAGHGFVGAIPFLTAASMVENRPLKAVLFAGSFWTCWSRINSDAHFLSQAVLGWSIAYLAVRSVNQTEDEFRRCWQVVPLELPEGRTTGLGVVFRY